jgi:hypothetical protein
VQLVAVVLNALIFGFFIQLIETGAARLFAPAPKTSFDSALLSPDHGISYASTLFMHNSLTFSAFMLSAILVSRTRLLHRAVPLGRTSGAVIGVVFGGFCVWSVASETSSIAAWVHGPPFFLLFFLPHGPLEFGAFVVPFLVLIASRGALVPDRVRLMCLSGVVGLGLLIAAAVVETWVSPVLLSFFPAG